jgi:3-oxoacyl-[acyl-carrier protein] reductase
LATEGASVALADIDQEAADEVQRALPEGARALSLAWDLSDLDCIDANVSRIEAELGVVDVLVNNTGGPPPGRVSGQPVDDWRKWYEAMVLPVLAITDRVLPRMRERNWGRIVTSTSSGVIAPIPNLGLSNTLRSALLGWSKTLAGEVGV